ncbi:UNVERIFIED_CONTAM: hypothetical protein Sangu_1515000 [Sesamum angustifolium]|uniref:Reverse transcriptase n=1 Tax=Sesamum angustifolium TaxID=2727405 RepID=A0AAW2MRM1_9LAMI
MDFILPKCIIKEIEKRLRNFLWKGIARTGYSKVAWSQVCNPVDEGELGVRDFRSLNLAFMSSQLWEVIQRNPSSLWVQWIYRIRLRNKIVWTASLTVGSWGWRKILRLRDTLLPNTIYHIGSDVYRIYWRVNRG